MTRRAFTTALGGRARKLVGRPEGSGPAELVPPPVRLDVEAGGTLFEYWWGRVRQQPRDWYAGVQLAKFPEDLRTYEHLLWQSRSNVVIEIGTSFGASALWFRDRLRTFAGYGRIGEPKVISIDLDVEAPRRLLAEADPTYEAQITLVDGDVLSPGLPDRIAALVPPGARCLVIEDSAHVFDTTMAALRGFARFVPRGGFLVVEDTYVDVEANRRRMTDEWPTGAGEALAEWLKTPAARDFEVRRDLEIYGVTVSPGGFLERTGGDARI